MYSLTRYGIFGTPSADARSIARCWRTAGAFSNGIMRINPIRVADVIMITVNTAINPSSDHACARDSDPSVPAAATARGDGVSPAAIAAASTRSEEHTSE